MCDNSASKFAAKMASMPSSRTSKSTKLSRESDRSPPKVGLTRPGMKREEG